VTFYLGITKLLVCIFIFDVCIYFDVINYLRLHSVYVCTVLKSGSTYAVVVVVKVNFTITGDTVTQNETLLELREKENSVPGAGNDTSSKQV